MRQPATDLTGSFFSGQRLSHDLTVTYVSRFEMPPSRHQSLKEANAHRPYAKDRDRHANSSRGGSLPEKGSSASAAIPVASSSDVMDASAEIKKEKRRKKKAAAVASGGRGGSNIPSSEMDVDIPAPRVKPLGITSQTAATNANVTAPTPHHDKTNDKPASSAAMKLQKLEQKIEKQRSRLKEAEARLIKNEEKGKRDAERILALEAKVKEQEESLKTKEQEAEGQKQRADNHAKVGGFCLNASEGKERER